MPTLNEQGTSVTAMQNDMPLWQMTQGAFIEAISKIVEQQVSALLQTQSGSNPTQWSQDRYVYGLDGLCRIFGCGRNKALEIKNSGAIDDAIVQSGRKIIINAERALECYKEYSRRNKMRRAGYHK